MTRVAGNGQRVAGLARDLWRKARSAARQAIAQGQREVRRRLEAVAARLATTAEQVQPATAMRAPSQPAAAAGEPDLGVEYDTLTMARIYEQQGRPAEAAAIYRRRLLRDPADAEAAARLETLVCRIRSSFHK
jgi:hypothetical protein